MSRRRSANCGAGLARPPGDPLIVHLDLVMRQAKGLLKSAESRPLSDVSLYSPITSPTKVIAAPANYRLHLTIDAKDPEVHHNVHVGLDKLERPVDKLGLFLKATSSIVGPAEGVTLKWPERRSDHEVELAIVIGRGGKGHLEGRRVRSCRRLYDRLGHIGPRHRGPQLPKVHRQLHRFGSVAHHRRRNSRSRRPHDLARG